MPLLLARPLPPESSGVTTSSAPFHRRMSPYSDASIAVAASTSVVIECWPEYGAAKLGWNWVSTVVWKWRLYHSAAAGGSDAAGGRAKNFTGWSSMSSVLAPLP